MGNKIITVSREFGSGGRELGKRLADALGVAYYDREIIGAIAKQCAMDEKYVESVLDRGLTVSYPYTFGRSFAILPSEANQGAKLMAEQHKIIRSLAEKGDCVIVGRNADVILEDCRPMKLFVYADMAAKLQRCRERAPEDENLTDKELEKKIRQIDKGRAATHGMVGDYPWGDRRGYHLCVNTTGVDIKALAAQVAAYARFWFKEN